MGCDGGTIPRRDELVITKKRPEKKDRDAELFFRWRMCAISQTPLQEPIVTCPLGRLYNKEAILHKLIERSSGLQDDSVAHIKNMKDIKVLNLSPNPAFISQSADKGDVYIDRGISPYICPIVGLEMNGKFKFVVIWSCGCVLSEKSIKEMKTAVCHKCQKPFKEDDLIILNATGDDLEALDKRLAGIKAANKSDRKKGDKRKDSEKPLIPEKKLKVEVSASSISKLAPGQKSKNSEAYKSIFTYSLPDEKHPTNWITHTTL